MIRSAFILLLTIAISATEGFSQKGASRFFGEPILADSNSTLVIPTRYNEEFLSVNKIAVWGGYYANLVFYNFKTDTYKKIFDQDTFIESFQTTNSNYPYSSRTNERISNLTTRWLIILVKTKDTNNSGRIDEKDPSVLYAVSTDGTMIRKITDENENVVSFENFEKQGFLLIKIQRDTNNDRSFKLQDDGFYFRKVVLSDLSLGKGIELP
jgi:hypothetical protein